MTLNLDGFRVIGDEDCLTESATGLNSDICKGLTPPQAAQSACVQMPSRVGWPCGKDANAIDVTDSIILFKASVVFWLMFWSFSVSERAVTPCLFCEALDIPGGDNHPIMHLSLWRYNALWFFFFTYK